VIQILPVKPRFLFLAFIAACSFSARASLVNVYDNTFTSFANGVNIPVGNLSGWSDSETLSGEVGTITSISVNLDIAGGFNGALYGYLEYNGVLVTLLNRTGTGSATPGSSPFGYANSGFDVTLSSSAANNIHFYQNVAGYNVNGNGQLTGTWQPDGSAISPLSSPASFDASPGAQSLNSFDGLSPDGQWTLFLANVIGGSPQPQVLSYGLDITTTSATVPEPMNTSLVIFAGLFLTVEACRAAWMKKFSTLIPVTTGK
jgi:hypothetical protein